MRYAVDETTTVMLDEVDGKPALVITSVNYTITLEGPLAELERLLDRGVHEVRLTQLGAVLRPDAFDRCDGSGYRLPVLTLRSKLWCKSCGQKIRVLHGKYLANHMRGVGHEAAS